MVRIMATVLTTNNERVSSQSSLLWKNVDEQYKQEKSTSPTAAGITELDRYLNKPNIHRHEDPLQWWSTHSSLYPRLFVMVKKRLCVPATSVPCERLFSKGGMVITERSSRMLAPKSSQFLFLNQNLRGDKLNYYDIITQ